MFDKNQNHIVITVVSYELFFFLDKILGIENFNQIAYIINVE